MKSENSQLPEGYKQTEVGVIPEDWEVKKLGEIFDIGAGGDFKPQFSSDVKDIKYQYPIYSNSVFNNGLYGFSSYYIYGENAITVTARGTLGVANFRDHKFTAIGRVLVLHPKKKTNCFFLSEFINNRIDFVVESTGVPQLPVPQIASYQVPLPPLPEQQAIAEVLSDVDSLITSLDLLLNKKRNIKQGTMQLLLTGKKRLPNFSGDWTNELLPQICWFQEGPGLRQWQFTHKGIKVINITNLEDGYLNLDRTDRHISIQEFNNMYQHFEIDDKDIVMASSGNSYSKVAVVRKKDLPLLMNTSVIRFKPLDSLDYDYLFAFLKSKDFKDKIDLMITGGAQPNFGPFHLKKIEVPLPPTKKEQKAIAQILSDMDAEIEALEAKRDKYKAIKQGMMQELLTGKIRLV